MTATFQIRKEIEHTINVPVPSFWKRELTGKIVGVCDTDSVFSLIDIKDLYTSVSVGALDRITAEEIEKMVPITEEEFFHAYNKAYESLRLKPEVREEDFTDSINRIISSQIH